MDRGSWWAAVYRDAESLTRLKQLSVHSVNTHTHTHIHIYIYIKMCDESYHSIKSQ